MQPNNKNTESITKKDIDILASGCLEPYSNAKYKYQVCTDCKCNSPSWNCLFERMEWTKHLLDKKISECGITAIKNLESNLGGYSYNSATSIKHCLSILQMHPSRLYVQWPPHSYGDEIGDIYLTKTDAQEHLTITKEILAPYCKELISQLEIISLNVAIKRLPKNKKLSWRF